MQLPKSSGARLVMAAGLLVVLTLASFGLAHLHLQRFGAAIALVLAAIKASIVAVAFMELDRASSPAKITAFVTLAFIAILCGGILGDVRVR